MLARRLVLLGGGHAHLEVLRSAAHRRFERIEVVLLSPNAMQLYSSMIPGYLQGIYPEREIAFDLAAMCAAGGVRFVEAAAVRVAGEQRIVETGNNRLEFDVASLDVGSDPASLDTPGARDHALTVRPARSAVALRRRVEDLLGEATRRSVSVCVVGAGAGGLEISLAIHRRIVQARVRAEVALIERAGAILEELPDRARARAVRILKRRGISIRTGESVASVSAHTVRLESGEVLPADVTVWLTGAVPPPLLARSDLPTDDRGFFLVDQFLRSVDGKPVWGAGDCVTLRTDPGMPKAGVYAVRAAPVLADNVRAAFEGGPMREFRPQRHFLAALNTADGRALLRWRSLVSHSRWAWWLKDDIDRRFMRKYQSIG